MRTVKLTTDNIIQQIVNAAGLQKDGFVVGNTEPVVVDGVLQYAIMKNIGLLIANKKGVVLVAEIDNGTENYKGIIGTLYRLRGGNNAFLIAEQYTITCLKAFIDTKFISSASIKVGKCTYNGKIYIGFTTESVPSVRLFFSGFYTGNCLFTPVPEADVTWID